MFAGAKLAGPRFGNYFRVQSPILGARMRNYTLGASDYEWYQKAKAAVARYEELVRRTNEIANQTARRAIFDWLGSPTNPAKPAYRYNTVTSDIRTDVEAYTPPNYGAYAVERRQGRVEELEGIVREFEAKVQSAEREYGRLPGATVIRETAPGPDLTLPIILAGSAVAAALILPRIL